MLYFIELKLFSKKSNFYRKNHKLNLCDELIFDYSITGILKSMLVIQLNVEDDSLNVI